MSLYPSLEDMKVDQMATAQYNQIARNTIEAPRANAPSAYGYPNFDSMPVPYEGGIPNNGQLYPALGEFMGLELSESVIAANMPEYSQALAAEELSELKTVEYYKNTQRFTPSSDSFLECLPCLKPDSISGSKCNSQPHQNNYTRPQTTSLAGLIAPISGQSVGLQRAQITHGIRELTLCKDQDGKVGVRVRAVNKGVFVSVVVDKSPAALAGLRFGDQILQINGENVAGFSMDKVHTMFKKSPENGIKVVVRDRPFERTLTLHKDSAGCIGFQFKNGKINTIVKDSSAARNGVLTDHQLLEVDGQNVVGLKDKEISNIIQKAGPVVTVTVIPCFLYDHMIKSMSGSLLKDLMDHSIPYL